MKLSVVGTGNVGTTLALHLYNKGVEFLSVVGSSEESAKQLAKSINATCVAKIQDIHPDSELILICVPDDKIEEVSAQIKVKHAIQAHTSGSVPMSQLKGEHRGVFYPLQTISKYISYNFEEVPFLLEASNSKVEVELDKLASKLTEIIRFKNSSERRDLHLAAVFVNNFTNHILQIGQELCSDGKKDFELLKPLVVQTIANAFAIGPVNAQTGPAKRNDVRTLENHRELLKKHPKELEVYNSLTKSILETFKENNL